MKYCVIGGRGVVLGFRLVGVDAVASATPISGAAGGGFTLWQLFIGAIPGTIGETCKLALLIGAAYLLYRKVISWHIPAAFIGTFAVCYLVATGFDVREVIYQLLSGGLILGAFFMATDYSSSPATPAGKLVFGFGCGLLLFIFRKACFRFLPDFPAVDLRFFQDFFGFTPGILADFLVQNLC